MSNSPQIEAFWRQCCESIKLDPATPYRVKVFGRDEQMAATLLGLVASGQKTGTFALVWEFQHAGLALPAVGDWVLVTDYQGAPGCVYRITEVEVVAFADIEARHVACEGPQLRQLQPWREVHRQFWTGLLEGTGIEVNDELQVVYQRFECRYPPVET